MVFNAMFAVFFTMMALMSTRVKSVDQVLTIFGNNLVISNVIGFAFWAVLHGLGPLLRKVNASSFLTVALFYAVLGTVIVTGSFFLLSQFPGYEGISRWLFTTQQFFTSFAISFVVSLVLASAWRNRVNELTVQIAIADERARVTSAERATTQANLRALQAQIEPHFLFNTLANVTSLIHTRPDDAKHMLEEFIVYLRASLATTRENETTLAKEFVLMQSFLSVLKVRMGNRLAVRVELPDDLQQFVLPPMLIQPLVENAIKHGVEPKIEGGEILLKAAKVGDAVAIEVTDTGLGFQNSTSNGIGLKNVRERLDKLYEGRATLTIEDNTPSGTKITIRIPA
jgi:sensor histidine kinase YesM